MANFKDSYKILEQVEFSKNPSSFLHQNKTEEHMTLGGIYRKYHQEAMDWDFVDKVLEVCESNKGETLGEKEEARKLDMKRASRMLYADLETRFSVEKFFKKHYWDTLRLGEIQSQKMANEIFLFGVVAGIKNSAKLAQRLIGVKDDGIIGSLTIKALNIYNEDAFDMRFDTLERRYYDDLVASNSSLKVYLSGWYNRSEIV